MAILIQIADMLLFVDLPHPDSKLPPRKHSQCFLFSSSHPRSTVNTALHLVAWRSDSVRGTLLRKRPDPSQLSNVWVDGKPEVMQGDVVLVLRVNAEGEHGFSFIRMMTEDGFAEGFIRSSYLTLRPLGTSVVAVAAVHRGGSSAHNRMCCIV